VPAQPAPTQPIQPYSLTPFGVTPNGQSNSGPIGGGNATESSARSVTGEEEDSFDIGSGAHGGTVYGGASHGDSNGPVYLGAPTFSGEVIPDSHVVRRGDTLWGICDYYYKNPYQWPRVWSYNAQIRNPNWIYPGDQVRLKDGAGLTGPAANNGAGGAGGGGGTGAGSNGSDRRSPVDRRRQVPSDTVFLRDEGWVRDDSDDVWGNLSGAAVDKMFLSDNDEVYITLQKGHEVHLGQELQIFRPRTTAAAGSIVQILGTARIDQYDPQDRVARAKIVESLDVMERGALVGPLARKFQIVPPHRNEVDVQAHVLASLHPHVFYGQNQVVFIDKGDAAGLKPGNRLFVVRRGDAWRKSLVTPGAGYRVAPDDERPMPPMEKTPGSRRDEEKYPDEVVAELRVLSVKKESAVCLVTQSKLEIELNDLAVARKGY
jgi:hypothetical protein